MENQSELKWYQKPTSVIILLILFFPIGLYLMWKNELWTKPTRWIITGVIILLVLANAGNKNKGGDSDNSSNYNTESNSENNSGSSESEEVSKDVYRQGYADGQTGYGCACFVRRWLRGGGDRGRARPCAIGLCQPCLARHARYDGLGNRRHGF